MTRNELQRVPQFRLIQIEQDNPVRCVGVFESATKLEGYWTGFLVNPDELCLEGRFETIDAQKWRAAFTLEDRKQIDLLVVGQIYAYLDVYWGDRATLVLDTTREWRRVLFQPQEAIENRSNGARILGKTGEPPPCKVDGEPRKIPGGWDHEHCDICWQEISKTAKPFGYTDQAADWVCEKCYEDFVQPRNLHFLTEQAIAQIRST
jgi:hypothetical protein